MEKGGGTLQKMKGRLTIKELCDILEKYNYITEESRIKIESRYPVQKKQLENKLGLLPQKNNIYISPIEVVASMGISYVDQKGERRALTEDKIVEIVANHFGIPYEKIDPLKLDAQLITSTISKPFARYHSLLPLRRLEDGTLVIATAEPYSYLIIEELRQITASPIKMVLSSNSDIQKYITDIYGFKKSIKAAEREFKTDIDLGNLEQLFRLKKEVEIESTDKHIVNAVDYLLHYALDQRASDIHIEPKRDFTLIRLRIDGVLHEVYKIPKVIHNAFVSRIKTMARMDIAERRKPQDGRIKTVKDGQEIELRVSTLPVAFGEKVVIRIFDPQMMMMDLEELGFFEREFKLYLKFISKPYGLILITGPTGSGKTTTLYSTLQKLASPEVNIVTIEDPIEMVIESLNQVAVQPKIDLSFGTALKHILRQDPDIIMVGEIRDPETAHYALQAALTGHLVFSTLHTNDSASAITRLLELDVNPYILSSTLIGVVAQRLVRIVCNECKEESFLTEEELSFLEIELPEEHHGKLKVWKGKGCPYCRYTGLYGRTGIFEVLEVTHKIRKLINEKADSKVIMQHARADGLMTLRECAVKKMALGITTFDEVIRVTTEEE